jgi:hypothetical protein
MTTTLSVSNLLYEELVLLQDILWFIENSTDYVSLLDTEDCQTFATLYKKVINS